MALGQRANSRMSFGDPATGAIPFAASTNLALAVNGRAVYIQTAGNLTCIMQDGGAAVTFTGLLAGQIYAIAIQSVVGATTTAVGLVLL